MCIAVKCTRAVALTLGAMLTQVAAVSGASTVSPKRLVEVVDLSAPVVSPDGRQVAFRAEQASVERNTYDSVWYVQDMEGRAPPRRVGDGGVPLFEGGVGSILEPATWSADGKFIYYRALLEDRIGVWRAAADGSGSEMVTLDPADVRDFSLSEDGRKLKFSVGATREEIVRAEQEEYDSGIHIDRTVPVGAPLFRSHYIDGGLRTQRYSGVGWNRRALLAERPNRQKEVDLRTREIRELPTMSGAENPTEPSSLKSAVQPIIVEKEPNGRRVAIVKPLVDDRASGDGPLDQYELSVLPDAEAGAPVVCRSELCQKKRITSIRWRPQSGEILFAAMDAAGGRSQSIARWNPRTGDIGLVAYSKGLLSGGRDTRSFCGLSREAMVCVVAEANVPPHLERIDIETGARKALFNPNASLSSDLGGAISARAMEWKDRAGRTFTGYLFSGRQFVGAKQPLFVNFYGCSGFLRGGIGDEWPLASLAVAGISTLCINAPPHQPDAIARFNAAVTAVESAVELLERQGEVDSDRVGMGGLSHGSETALWVAVESRVLSAVSISSPTVSPLWFLMGGLKGEMFYPAARANWSLGSPEETPDQWRRISLAYNLEKLRVPALFQMSEEEYIYALDYAIPLIQKQKADLFVFPDEPHQKFQPRHREAIYQRNLDWFRFWLQGVEDRSPTKAEQYARWRSMRQQSLQNTATSRKRG